MLDHPTGRDRRSIIIRPALLRGAYRLVEPGCEPRELGYREALALALAGVPSVSERDWRPGEPAAPELGPVLTLGYGGWSVHYGRRPFPGGGGYSSGTLSGYGDDWAFHAQPGSTLVLDVRPVCGSWGDVERFGVCRGCARRDAWEAHTGLVGWRARGEEPRLGHWCRLSRLAVSGPMLELDTVGCDGRPWSGIGGRRDASAPGSRDGARALFGNAHGFSYVEPAIKAELVRAFGGLAGVLGVDVQAAELVGAANLELVR